MAIIIEMTEEQQKEWDKWVESRPPVIQKMAKAYPPNRLYRLTTTGQRVTILAYGEDGTIRVLVTGKYNFISFDREVFGIEPATLEECELPEKSELVGTILATDEEINGFIEILHKDKCGGQYDRTYCKH